MPLAERCGEAVVGGGELATVAQPKLLDDVRQVHLDRRIADHQAVRDFLVAEARSRIPKDLALADAQALLERRFINARWRGARKLLQRRDDGVPRRPDLTRANGADGLQQAFCRLALEQDAAGAGG